MDTYGGYLFLTGKTNATDFPHVHLTPWTSAYDQTTGLNSGCSTCTGQDAIIVALTGDGQFNPWSTWYGGSGDDIGEDIRVSRASSYAGEIYMVGYSSGSFPFAGTPPSWSAGKGFIVHMDATGAAVFGSNIGSSGGGIANAVNIDQFGDVVVAGSVPLGSGFPIQEPSSGNVGNSTYGGGQNDGFVTKISGSNNASISWSTYFGGSGDDNIYDVAVTPTGAQVHYYVVGTTNSSATPIPVFNPGGGAFYHGTLTGSSPYGDALIADFDLNGNIPWATYFGGTNYDQGFGITLDDARNIYITGQTYSNSSFPFPSTNLWGGYDDNSYNGGTSDSYVAGFTHDSYSHLWTTYFGGSNLESGYGIGTYDNTTLYIDGFVTCTSGFPLYSGPGCLGTGTPYFDAAFQNPVTLAPYHKGYVAGFCIDQIISNVPATNQSSSQNLSITPNPSTDFVWIRGDIDAEDAITIDVFDITGRIVHSEKMEPVMTMDKQLDLSALTDGVYLIRVNTNEKSFIQKVIIQR